MITLTEEQANTVVQLIDAAVRSGGLQLAKAAIPIVDQMMQQVASPSNGVWDISILLHRIECGIQDARMRGCGDQLDEQLQRHGYFSPDTVAAALGLDRDDIEEAIDKQEAPPCTDAEQQQS